MPECLVAAAKKVAEWVLPEDECFDPSLKAHGRLDRLLKPPILDISIADQSLVASAQTQHYPILSLSNLDHYVPILYCTLHVYHISSSSYINASKILRDGLAKALVDYYPLTGRIKENDDTGKLEVQYKEVGVPYVEAYANNDIKDVGDFTRVCAPYWTDLIPNFSSYPGSQYGGLIGGPILHVQVTQFRRGGFSIGMAMNHMMIDGMSWSHFMDHWSSMAKGMAAARSPSFDRAFLMPSSNPRPQFPHLECCELQDISNLHDVLHNGTFEYGTFKFQPCDLDSLKAAIIQEAQEHPLPFKCTKFEALAALVWQARTKSLRLKPAQMVKFVFSLNGRSRLPHSSAKDYIGNLVLYPAVVRRADDVIHQPLSNIVRWIQDAKMGMNADYIQSALDHYEVTHAPPTHDDLTFCISEWSSLGLYEASDFGWGAPLFVGPSKPSPPTRELGAILLTSTRTDHALHLLVGLPPFAMETFSCLLQDYSITC